MIGIFAKTFPRPTLEATLDAVAATGLSTMQFNLALTGGPSLPERIPDALAAHVREQSAARGLTIAAVSGTYNMAHADPAVRADGLRRLNVLIASARALGTSIVTLCTGTRDSEDQWRRHPDNATPAAWEDMLRSLTAALDHARAHNVTLAFEPEHANVVDSAAAGARLLEALPDLRVIIDPANLFAGPDLDRQGAVLTEAFDLLGDQIVLAHAKDVRRDGSIVAAGQGELDYRRYRALLEPRVPLILHGLREDEVPGAIAAIMVVAQLDISPQILTVLAVIAVGGAVLGLALAFGLGSREAARDISAGRYVAATYVVGQHVRVAGAEGEIIALESACAVLKRADAMTLRVPHHLFLRDVVEAA